MKQLQKEVNVKVKFGYHKTGSSLNDLTGVTEADYSKKAMNYAKDAIENLNFY